MPVYMSYGVSATERPQAIRYAPPPPPNLHATN